MPECFRLARRRHNVSGTTYRASMFIVDGASGFPLCRVQTPPESGGTHERQRAGMTVSPRADQHHSPARRQQI